MKKYLDYRFSVDQITKGSLSKEQTHLRYLLEWSQETSFRDAMTLRPSFPEYMRTTRLDGKQGRLSAVYIKKALATARLFFSWLSDNEVGYKHIRFAWVKTIKAKRLSDAPKVKDVVSLEEIFAMASQPVQTVAQRRARAMVVFLYLSGIRIGAFASLPLQAVDISKRQVIQYPSLGVRTKNKKFGITYLLDIPELLKVVQEWDDEVRSVLPLDGFWFAPLLPDTGQIDLNKKSIGEHRGILAARNIKQWLQEVRLPYHSPHKFRHGHVHYGMANSNNIADYKAVSMNVMHESMEITDQAYSVLNDAQIQNKIKFLGKGKRTKDKQDIIRMLEELLSDIKK